MEGKKSDEQRQMKKTEDKEMSSEYRSGFHKNSDDLIISCGAENGKSNLESVGNGVSNESNPDKQLPAITTNNPLLELTNQSDGELLRQLMGEHGRETMVEQMAAEGMGWWKKRMDKMSSEEFQKFYAALGIFQERLHTHLQQRLRVRDSDFAETSTSRSNTNGRIRRSRGR